MLGTRTLVLLAAGYLGLLFAVAALVDRSKEGGALRRFSRHPAVTVLALGVYSTAWTFFASVGFAAAEGWRMIGTQTGQLVSFALVPVLWMPLLRVVKARQLGSLSDLLAYRYQSRLLAGLVTAFLLVSSLPYQALQLHAIVEMVSQLGGVSARSTIAASTTGVLMAFGVIYGVRHLTPRERHDGMITAVALETVVKLIAHVALIGFVLWGVFNGFGGLGGWLESHPEELIRINKSARESSWNALILFGGAGIFLLPRQWHLAFTEGDERSLRAASYGLPPLMLVLHLSVPLVLWGGRALGLPGAPDFYALGIVRASGSTSLGAVVFLGGLAAATAMIIVTTVALAGMVHHDLILPFTGVQGGSGRLYSRLLWIRRGLVAGIILAGYGVYLITEQPPRLVNLGLVAFVAVIQLVPAVLGVLFFQWISARGVIYGLLAGAASWVLTPVIPVLAGRPALPIDTGTDLWTFSTVLSLSANGFLLVWGSLRKGPTRAEQEAADFCRLAVEPPARRLAGVRSAADFVARLRPVLGSGPAKVEVQGALLDLGLDLEESRSEKLNAIVARLERNLSGLFGPMLARAVLDEHLGTGGDPRGLLAAQLRHMEEQIAAARLDADPRGVHALVDRMRRYLRSLLAEMPIGVCAIAPDGSILVWNRALEQLTGLSAEIAALKAVGDLPEPWASLFAHGGKAQGGELKNVHVQGEIRSIRIQFTPLDGALFGADAPKSRSPSSPPPEEDGTRAGGLYLLQDQTEELALSARLSDAERLAALGTMSAVLAHEIRNPLTALKGYSQLLLKSLPEGSEPKEQAGIVVGQAIRLEELVNNLLDFARTGAIDKRSVDVVELVRSAAREFAPKAELDLSEAPSSWCLDGQRMFAVLGNLLRNAEQVSPGEVHVVVATSGSELVIQVCDRGTGFAEGAQERAFEPFYTTKTRGVGLGLTVARRLVEKHGGRICAQNRPEGGAEVRVSIP